MARKGTTEDRDGRPGWATYLEDRMGCRLWADKARRWELAMDASSDQEGLGGCPSNIELIAVLQFARDKGKSADGLTVDRLMGWVRWYRKDQREQREGMNGQGSAEEFVAWVKARMLRLADHRARWDAMCDPAGELGATRTTTAQECAAIDEWADERWEDWRTVTTAYRRELGEAIRRCVASIGRDVSRDEDAERTRIRCHEAAGRV